MATTSATASSGFSSPLVVSQCTSATSVRRGSAARAEATAAGSITRFSGASTRPPKRPSRRAMAAMRRPYEPFARTSSRPSRGTSEPIAASTAKVPLPWIGTATWVSATPARAASRVRTPSDRAMKAASREPQSRSSAARVALDVVNGPGVSSSVVMGSSMAPPYRK